MDYLSFLERVIDEGIEAAKADYTKPEDRPRLEGSIAGFEMCRNMSIEDLAHALAESGRRSSIATMAGQDDEEIWFTRCVHAEIEWVCNVVSAMLANSGLSVITTPTARGVMKAAEILGVAE